MKIPLERLAPEILNALIEEFVLREGTEYGEREYSLAEKIQAVKQQLERGEAFVAFDPDSESCTILPAKR
ncbi:MAG: YheU family protein [Bdellovibrionales bacterium]|nr:YheU family protein [Bdellovibrionales bacterium]